MAEIQLLGLFHTPAQVSDAVAQLRGLGVPDAAMTVMSGFPYRATMLNAPAPRGKVWVFSLIGALLGLGLGLTFTVVFFLLYPLNVGGQGIVPLPPTLIILFETTMLGTMWTTFFGLWMLNRFPRHTPAAYDPRITEGHVGVSVALDESLGDRARELLVANGAHHTSRTGPRATSLPLFKRFWWAVVIGLIFVTIVALLPFFDVVKLSIPTNMAEQDSIAYDEGPRLAAPAAAVPVQGPVLIGGRPASQPKAADANSLQRGKVLFGMNCQLCHGPDGSGNGPLAGFFTPKPVDLRGAAVKALTDDDIFMVITQGFNLMPPIYENLTPDERWDVINYVRSLSK